MPNGRHHEIRDRHPRRRCRRAAGVARRQDAARGGAHAEHGSRRRRWASWRGPATRRRALPAGSEIGNLSLLGYNPFENFTGRAPLEAAAQGIELGPDDWAIRCNLVTVEDQVMRDFTADHITHRGSARELLATAQEQLPATEYRGAAVRARRQLSQPADLSRRRSCRRRSRPTRGPRRRTT